MTSSPDRLKGKVALVTGAASGMGAATAVRLIDEGATVVLADRNADGLARIREAIADDDHVRTATFDQTDSASVATVFDEVLSEFPRLDVAVLAAGFGRYGELMTLSAESWHRHMDVNLTGTFLALQASARRMAECGNGGSIVVFGSTASAFPTDLFGAYSASKAGVLMLARVAAAELGSHRIRVNTIMPGVIDTPMTEGILADDPTRAMVDMETPLGRCGDPDDVAAAVAFLVSDDATFVTGTSLIIDGGQTLHGLPRWFSVDHRLEGPPTWEPHTRRFAVQDDGGRLS